MPSKARARVVKSVDTADLKSADSKKSCRFDSGLGHQKYRNFWGFYTIKVALHPDFMGYPLRIGGQLGGDFLKHQPEYVNDSGS